MIKNTFYLVDMSLYEVFKTLPARDVANTFVHHYIKTTEMTFRILHIPSFTRVYEQYWERPRSIKPACVTQII